MTCSNSSCGCNLNCTGVAVVASIIIGIITAFLRFTAVITVTPAFLWVLFGIAIVYLAVNLVVSAFGNASGSRDCVCSILSLLLIAILGTILLSIVLLAVTFAAASVVGAILTGLLLIAFSLVVTLTACMVRCMAGCIAD